MNANVKQKFTVTTYFTYSVTVEIEAENENVALMKGRKQAINTPLKDMEFVGTENTLVMDNQLNVLCED